MLTLTEQASAKVKDLLAAKGLPEGALRVFVVGGGCAGYQYGMALAKAWDDDDILIEHDGVKVVVDPESSLLLEGAEIDYVEDVMRSGFTVFNPSAIRSCACGSSFQAPSGGAPNPCGR